MLTMLKQVALGYDQANVPPESPLWSSLQQDAEQCLTKAEMDEFRSYCQSLYKERYEQC